MRFVIAIAACLLFLEGQVFAQPVRARKEFPRGALRAFEELPAGRFRERISKLPQPARERAVQWLGRIHFTTEDLATMHVDKEGGVYFVDEAPEELANAAA